MTSFGRLVVLLLALVFVTHVYVNQNTVETETETQDWLSIIPLDETEVIEAEEFLVQIDPDELKCLQRNIYFEAGNQSVEGKEAVALVTLNRMRATTYPDSVCGVVYQRKQFSWTFLKKNHDPPNHPVELRQWEISGNVALAALRGEVDNFLGDSTHYHATYVNPSWSRSSRMQRVATVGTHIFYVDTKRRFKS